MDLEVCRRLSLCLSLRISDIHLQVVLGTGLTSCLSVAHVACLLTMSEKKYETINNFCEQL